MLYLFWLLPIRIQLNPGYYLFFRVPLRSQKKPAISRVFRIHLAKKKEGPFTLQEFLDQGLI
jgi:hypothetical protein